jgi:uncharacterized membrane protein
MTDVRSMTRDALETVADANPTKPGGPLSGAKGAAAGVALAVLPIAVERIAKTVGPKVSDKVSDLGDQATGKAKEIAGDAADKATPDLPQGLTGGGGLLKKVFSRNGGGDDEDGESGRAAPGYGSGRRMPIQQAIDVAVPIEVAYNAWTQFEEWPRFMHRVDSVDQVEDAKVSFSTKVWGITKRFEAQILEQRPEERIEWDVSQGLSHTGVVTFHKLTDRLTRIEVTVDVEPDSLLEKAGRGMRYSKRAVRGDLHRFKAYVELEEDEIEDGWRGTIEDGKVKRRTERKRSTSSGRSRSSNSQKSGNRSSSRSRSRGKSSSGSSRKRASSGSSRRG